MGQWNCVEQRQCCGNEIDCGHGETLLF